VNLRDLLDDRGWAEGAEAKDDATWAWLKEATAELVQLRADIAALRAEIASLDRKVESRTAHLV
jgi:hypothetical protein